MGSGVSTVPPLAPVRARVIAAVAMANRLSALLIGRHRPESEKSLGSLSASPSLPHSRPKNSDLPRMTPQLGEQGWVGAANQKSVARSLLAVDGRNHPVIPDGGAAPRRRRAVVSL